MSDTRWKAFERRVAVLLGTRRIPVTGERDGADAETPMFCFQFKKRARQFPAYVADWLDKVCGKAACRSPAKIGVVVLQRPGGRDLDALVIVSLRDWLDLHGSSRRVEIDVSHIVRELEELNARDLKPREAVHAEQSTTPASTKGQP